MSNNEINVINSIGSMAVLFIENNYFKQLNI